VKYINIIVRLIFVALLVTFVISYFVKDNLVGISSIHDSTKSNPVQTTIKNAKNFSFNVGESNYGVAPIDDYKISGVVVSKHDYNPPDYDIEKPARYDLCLVWGSNVVDKIYLSPDISFSQSDRFCNYHYSKPVNFNTNGISNNHLITTNDSVLAKLATIRDGDEVLVTGRLINMTGFTTDSRAEVKNYHWNSSTIRTDTGEGACEVIYVDSIDILTPSHNFGVEVNQYSLWAIIGIIAIFVLQILSLVLFIKPKTKGAGGFYNK
jgi:hypothetical protein